MALHQCPKPGLLALPVLTTRGSIRGSGRLACGGGDVLATIGQMQQA
jgi:hypothetical protein